MSDTILLGVLRLPIHCWDESELGQLHRYDRYLEAADRIESDAANIAELLDIVNRFRSLQSEFRLIQNRSLKK
jgi:hypothetical protein